MLQAEDGAVGGYGHRDDNGVDVHHIGVETQNPAEIVESEGDEDEAEECRDLDSLVAEHRF